MKMNKNYSYGSGPGNKDNGGRSGRRKVQLTQLDGEKDEDYKIRRKRNNEAVRKSRDKSKKKTEETLKRVQDLKLENCRLEENIRIYRNQLSNLKGIFLAHAGSGKMNVDIDFDALLNDSDVETEGSTSSTTIVS